MDRLSSLMTRAVGSGASVADPAASTRDTAEASIACGEVPAATDVLSKSLFNEIGCVGAKLKCPETLAKRHGIDPGVEMIPHQFIRQRQRSLIQLCPQLRAPTLSFLQVIDHDRW